MKFVWVLLLEQRDYRAEKGAESIYESVVSILFTPLNLTCTYSLLSISCISFEHCL